MHTPRALVVSALLMALACGGGPDSESRLVVTQFADGTEHVEEVAVAAPKQASTTEWPRDCEAPVGAVVVLACAGGGRPLVDAFLEAEREGFGAGSAHLRGLAERLPAPALDAEFAPALDAVYEDLVQQAGDMYLAGKDDAYKARFATWSLATETPQTSAWNMLREATGLHFNAANGLLALEATRGTARDHAARQALNQQDLGMDATASDLAFVRSVGDALGNVAIGMKATSYGEARMSVTMAGPQP